MKSAFGSNDVQLTELRGGNLRVKGGFQPEQFRKTAAMPGGKGPRLTTSS
jgi:hypothetical protein